MIVIIEATIKTVRTRIENTKPIYFSFDSESKIVCALVVRRDS